MASSTAERALLAHAGPFAACATHPAGLIPHAVILDRVRGLIPWEDWPHLRTLLDDWTRQRRSVILKSRQLGVSWAVALYGLWVAKFSPGANVLLLSQGQDEAADLLDKCRTLETHFPHWLRYRRGKDNDSELEFPVMNSRIVALPSTEKAGRSNQGTLVVMDEFAFHQYASESLTALLPTVGDAGQIIVPSTANGMGGPLYGLWENAHERGFARTFIPWHARPDRDAAWYAERERELGPQVKQEYPATAEEAFLQSGSPVFPGVSLVPMDPVPTPDDWPAETILYRPPTPGMRYLIGADPAEGLAHGDRSCAVVLELDDLGRGSEAAHLCGPFEPELFALQLDCLATAYGALLGVERNNHGHAVLVKLRQMIAERVGRHESQRYMLYAAEGLPEQAQVMEGEKVGIGRLGWHTNVATKPTMISELASALRTELATFHTPAMLAELQAYQRNDDGTTGAPKGKDARERGHDDRVVALAIAWQMRKPFRVIATPRVPMRGYQRG